MRHARPPAPHGGRHGAGISDPGIIDFSASISPAGPPASAARAARRAAAGISEYPDPGSSGLIGALARYTGLPKSRIHAGAGAAEIIYDFCRTAIPGRRVLIQAPTFAEYESAARLAGCRPEFFGSMDLAADLDGFMSRIPRGGCVFVCNPNNPTGAMLSGRQVLRIASAAQRRSCMVLVDECFVELARDPSQSVIGAVPRRKNLVVLRSLTKSFALAGLRVGYAACPPGVARALSYSKVPWSVSRMAQEAGEAAVRERGYLARSRRMIAREAEYLRAGMSKIPGLECMPAAANFVLVRTRRDSTVLQRRLLKMGILVRDCSSFRGLGRGHIRVAVRTRRENAKLLRALEAAS